MEQDTDLVAVIVNLQDYTVGADAGGALNMFDDFDIDWLTEGRAAGQARGPGFGVEGVQQLGQVRVAMGHVGRAPAQCIRREPEWPVASSVKRAMGTSKGSPSSVTKR